MYLHLHFTLITYSNIHKFPSKSKKTYHHTRIYYHSYAPKYLPLREGERKCPQKQPNPKEQKLSEKLLLAGGTEEEITKAAKKIANG